MPSVIKAYKHITIAGDRAGMRDTGIDVRKEDQVSILATGSIDFCAKWGGCKYRNVTPADHWPLIGRIGKEGHYFHPIVRDTHKGGFSLQEGRLYLGCKDGPLQANGRPYNPEWYRDNQGTFSVDIIVWSTDDYGQIINFLSEQLEENPENKAIKDTLYIYATYRQVQLAAEKAAEAAQETQQEISDLQRQTANRPTSATERQQIQELEARLASLQATLAELDQMKKQLQQEQQKSEQLTASSSF
ncbi:MAG: hypothetical protein AMJ54_15740 [Deltaproteobacteria bacterium SG8_13]|nr:MAG: hypothetical protein AMJ54_15740 [Deltaproteobacteria bacterium SG8_13]